MTQAYMPLVSVIIPVYNGANYLAEAIDSAAAQTYPNIEIIVVNDGSEDEGATEKIALGYGDKIRYFKKENGGVSSALNFGIQKMRGEWFSWLSHDDLYSPQKIEHAVNALRKISNEREKTVVYSSGSFITAEGKFIREIKARYNDERLYTGLEAVQLMLKKGALNGCGMLIHKNALKAAGGFDENLRYSQDSLMWYNLFLGGCGLYQLKDKDIYSRVHRRQVSNTRKDLFYHDSLVIAEKLAPKLKETVQLNPRKENVYYRYVLRLTKHNSKDAIRYMTDYAEKNNLLSKAQLLSIKANIVLGKISCRLKNLIKKLIAR